MNSFYVLFWIRLSKINKRGEAPLYCRITKGGRRFGFSTGFFSKPEEWNAKTQTHKRPHINLRLQDMKIRLEQMEYIAELNEKSITLDMIKKAAQGNQFQNRTTLETVLDEFYQRKVNHLKGEGKTTSSFNSYRIRIANLKKHLSEFSILNQSPSAVDELMIEDITRSLARQYHNNYVQKHLQLLIAVFKFAKQKEYIKTDPFAGFKLSFKRSPQTRLKQDDIRLLSSHTFASTRLEQVRDLFLFQCYTGFAWVDLNEFDPKTMLITSNEGVRYISKPREKTDQMALIPLWPEAVRILEKYSQELPVISNQKYNAYLKEVADVVGIEKRLTTHVARRTFSQTMRDAGYSNEVVAKMMGHADTTMLKVYSEIDTGRIDLEISRNHPERYQLMRGAG